MQRLAASGQNRFRMRDVAPFPRGMSLKGLETNKPHNPEFKNFLIIAQALAEMGLRPFRAEVCLAHMGLCVCGQLEESFASSIGKKCGKIKFQNPCRSLKEPLNNSAECNGNVYSLQLSTYKPIC